MKKQVNPVTGRMTNPDLLNIAKSIEILGVTRKIFKSFIDKGLISPVITNGTHLYFSRASLENLNEYFRNYNKNHNFIGYDEGE